MVNKKTEELVDQVNKTYVEKVKLNLAPKFVKKEDKSLGGKVVEEVSDIQKDKISEICPHYYILRERYSEYKNPDPEEKNPLGFPLRIDRRHGLAGFEATISQADVSKDFDVFPTRLIKVFVYNEQYQRQPFLIVDKRVVGLDTHGRSTNISSIRTGYYEYPEQFEQNSDGEWRPVSNQFKKIYDIPFEKETVLKFAHTGNPYIKKYVVWHPDGALRGHFTLEQFINLTDEEQIDLIKTGKI